MDVHWVQTDALLPDLLKKRLRDVFIYSVNMSVIDSLRLLIMVSRKLNCCNLLVWCDGFRLYGTFYISEVNYKKGIQFPVALISNTSNVLKVLHFPLLHSKQFQQPHVWVMRPKVQLITSFWMEDWKTLDCSKHFSRIWKVEGCTQPRERVWILREIVA